MESYLTHIALERSTLHPNADAPSISDEAFAQLVADYREGQQAVTRMTNNNIAPREILHQLLSMPTMNVEDLKDKAKLEEWTKSLIDSLPDSRSEERRVGKECKSRRSPYDQQKKK